jgi:hypothetical protein
LFYAISTIHLLLIFIKLLIINRLKTMKTMRLLINGRLKQVRKHLCNGKNKDFASAVGESTNTTSNWMVEGYSIGIGVISKIAAAFPNVNLDWLITGDGEMLKSGNVGHSTTGNHSPISGDIQVNEHQEALLKAPHLEMLLKEKDERLAELKTLYEQRLQDIDEIIALLKRK